VAEWRLKEIIALIHQKLLNAGINEIPPRGIILAGDMAKLSVLNYLVRKEFATDAVRIGISTRNIAGTANLELAHPRYATAIGLVLSQFVPFDGRVKTVSIQGATKQSRSNNLGKNLWNRLIGGDRDNLDQRYAD
jgi:cell division protein FtsA